MSNLRFNVILGMDWFVGNCVFIDCFKHQVTLFNSEGDRIKFVGDQLDLSIPFLSPNSSQHPSLGSLLNFMTVEYENSLG